MADADPNADADPDADADAGDDLHATMDLLLPSSHDLIEDELE